MSLMTLKEKGRENWSKSHDFAHGEREREKKEEAAPFSDKGPFMLLLLLLLMLH